MLEPENGDWLRRSMDIAVTIGCAVGASPLFRAATLGAWKKGTGTDPQRISGEVDIDPGSEPVPIFHSNKTGG